MIETGTNSPQSFKPFAFLDDMYNWSTAEFGYPMEFHLFDDRLAEALDLSWLREQVCPHLVSDDELEKIVESGVLKSCATQGGSPGFLLYTPEQIKTYEELRALQRYGDDELKHIMAMWAADIEGTVDVLPYDDPELSSFDSYRRKLIEYIDETKRQIGYVHESSLLDDERGKRLKFFEAKLEQCEKVVRKLDSWNPSALTPEMNKYIERPLFRMRWVDESIRIGNSERFRAAVLRGYSPEVFFSRYSESSDGFTFDRIDWEITLRTFRETRSQGKVFPLRTPDFDLVERGMILHKPLLPQDYAKLCDRYQIGEMTQVIEKLGPELWNPPRSNNSVICIECGTSFPHTLDAKRYCSAKCRSRAKQRRYRERDPERARLSQARYWKSYLDEC